jgi:hypothetical protein
MRRESSLAPVIDRLAEEHVVIHGVLEGADRVLADRESRARLGFYSGQLRE